MDKFNNDIINTYNKRIKNKRELYLPSIPSNIIASNQLFYHISNFISNYYGTYDFTQFSINDFGSGRGIKANNFISIGFAPENITCIEIHPLLSNEAKSLLPKNIKIINQSIIEYGTNAINNDCDIAFQSMALSSINNQDILIKTARSISNTVKKKGLFISYDFVFTKPSNKNVVPIKISTLKSLFPDFILLKSLPITVAPPIARIFDKFAPRVLPLISSIKLLNTHRLCLFKKK